MTGSALALALALALSTQPTPEPALPEETFGESIDVSLVTVRLGAFDRRNEPILGLDKDDFAVTINGEPIEIVAVEWQGPGLESSPTRDVGPTTTGVTLPRLSGSDELPGAPPRRLLIFFVQNDFDPSRLIGFIRLKDSHPALVDQLGPGDLGAVVVFSTHLEIRQDLTDDQDRLIEVLKTAHHREIAPFPEPRPSPSLANVLDADAAKDVATMEHALELLADGLDRLPGEKAIILLGHGLGEVYRGKLLMSPYYEQARNSLLAAKVPVIGIDVTYAAAHSQSGGFAQLTRETGGSYHSTTYFPEKAVRQVGEMLAGRYVLTLAGVDVSAGRHELDVRLVSRRGRLAVQTAVIQPTR